MDEKAVCLMPTKEKEEKTTRRPVLKRLCSGPDVKN